MPKLGGVIEEDAESVKRRKKAPIAWNAKDMYMPWPCGVPASTFWIGKCLIFLAFVHFFINFTMCLIDDNRRNDEHCQKDIESVVNLEMSNEIVVALGPVAAPWVAQNKMLKTRCIQPCRFRNNHRQPEV
jgi:hypothetical protein